MYHKYWFLKSGDCRADHKSSNLQQDRPNVQNKESKRSHQTSKLKLSYELKITNHQKKIHEPLRSRKKLPRSNLKEPDSSFHR
jgi:hypothetical protein